MTYDLALYPAAGPGLGHLMRCYALAEAAVEMGKRVVVVLEKWAPEIEWPCAVELRGARTADVVIVDGKPNMSAGPAWFVIDEPPELVDPRDRHVEGYIYPHFGAVPIDGLPTFVGPRWMPLRKAFSQAAPVAKRERALSYRLPDDVYVLNDDVSGMTAAQVRDAMWSASEIVCPPSTIAYEAMACGCSVILSHADQLSDPHPAGEAIGEAMVAAGAATWWPDHVVTVCDQVDGRGALRLLEALL